VATLGIDRSLQYGLEYYLDRPLPEWNPRAPRSAWLWTPQAYEADLARTPGWNCTVLYKLSKQAWLVRIAVSGS
jgi:hypothetical protein